MKTTNAGEDRIERRTLLKGLAAGLAGTVGAPAVAGAVDGGHPVTADAVQAPPAPIAVAAGVFDDFQRRTLTSLADSLVPGAVDAGVVDLLDRVASVETPARQRQLLNAIGHFEQEARMKYGKRWIDLEESVRLDILRQASTAPASGPEQPAWVKGEPMIFEAAGPSGPPTLRDHFEFLKTTIATAYYTTESGMKERGWSGQNAWREFPGCPHASAAHD